MKHIKPIIAFALVFTLGVSALALAATDTSDYGANAVKEGETYSVEEILTYALQDELLALAEYQAIMEAYDVDRPFSNIIRAEAMHRDRVLELFAAHNIPVPEVDPLPHVILPESMDDIYAAGVKAEEQNIVMYKIFLSQDDLPEDVIDGIDFLLRGSENHLRAFTRAGARSGGMRTPAGQDIAPRMPRQRPAGRGRR